MKQISKTPEITALLKQSVGASVNTDNLAVYEAIALNNRPIRKEHPLFKGAVADRSLLLEMAAALSIESRPIHVQHDKEGLPAGRAFHGKVVDRGNETELRVLFFLDKGEDTLKDKIDSGTFDQVSVSVIPKKLLNSKSGFDYLGAEAKPENIWTGADDKGNTIGKDGVFARMVGLGSWHELSLVSMGGAENARIVSHDESYFGSSYQKLAASGVDPSVFLLEASTENETMDLSALTDKLVTLSADFATANASIATLTASNAALTTQVADLTAQLAAAAKPDATLTAAQAELTAKTEEATALTADVAAATTALQGVAKAVLAATGKMDTDVTKMTVTELTALIDESKVKLSAALVVDGKSGDSNTDAEKKTTIADFSAFRRPGRRN
jgi:hypothetical protein